MNLKKQIKREKEFLALCRRRDILYDKIRNSPLQKLEVPYQSGWDIYVDVRDDIKNRKDYSKLAVKYINTLTSLEETEICQKKFLFTVLKILPLIIVPIAGIFFIKTEHFIPFNPTGNSALSAINAAALLTLWGFIGVESATTPAGSVLNPTKTIPRAIIFGTLIVSFVYIFNSFVIMGVMQPNVLLQSKAPFSDAAALIFGGNWSYIISLVASIVCLGTLNAWILTSGQIALGAASDRLFPKFFARKNKKGAPILSLITSSIGMIPLLILTLDANLINQVNSIIDISVTAFLLVYLMSVLSYLKLFCNFRSVGTTTGRNALLIGILALIFCGWALWASGLKMISLGLLITLSGAPIYLWNRRSHERDSLSEKVG